MFGMTEAQFIQYMYWSNIVFLLVIFVSRKQIKNVIKTLLLRKWGFGRVIEIGKNKSIKEHICKIYRGKTEIKELSLKNNRTYQINPEDIFIDPIYVCSSVIVSEKTSKSINPTGKESDLSPQAVDDLIIEAYSQGDKMSKREKMIMYALMAACAIGLLLGGQYIFNITDQIEIMTSKIDSLDKSVQASKDIPICVSNLVPAQLNETIGSVVI